MIIEVGFMCIRLVSTAPHHPLLSLLLAILVAMQICGWGLGLVTQVWALAIIACVSLTFVVIGK